MFFYDRDILISCPLSCDFANHIDWLEIKYMYSLHDLTEGRAQPNLVNPKKNILKSNSFDAMQTFLFAFTCKFGLVLSVEKVVICINKTNCGPLVRINLPFSSLVDWVSAWVMIGLKRSCQQETFIKPVGGWVTGFHKKNVWH